MFKNPPLDSKTLLKTKPKYKFANEKKGYQVNHEDLDAEVSHAPRHVTFDLDPKPPTQSQPLTRSETDEVPQNYVQFGANGSLQSLVSKETLIDRLKKRSQHNPSTFAKKEHLHVGLQSEGPTES